jgi:hypothetical protein
MQAREAALMVAPESVTRYSTLVHLNSGLAEARAGRLGVTPQQGAGHRPPKPQKEKLGVGLRLTSGST